MKVSPVISDSDADEVIELAKIVGLDQLNYEATFAITKFARKLPNDEEAPHLGYYAIPCIGKSIIGDILLVGNDRVVCLLVGKSLTNRLRTSSIMSCKKEKDGVFIIETLNSFYKLEEL